MKYIYSSTLIKYNFEKLVTRFFIFLLPCISEAICICYVLHANMMHDHFIKYDALKNKLPNIIKCRLSYNIKCCIYINNNSFTAHITVVNLQNIFSEYFCTLGGVIVSTFT